MADLTITGVEDLDEDVVVAAEPEALTDKAQGVGEELGHEGGRMDSICIEVSWNHGVRRGGVNLAVVT